MTAPSFLKEASSCICDLLFPRRCCSCLRAMAASSPLCELCEYELAVSTRARCYTCASARGGQTLSAPGPCDPEAEHAYVRSGFLMRGPGADLIHAFKYGGAPSLAGFIAARMAAAWMPGRGPVPDYLVPVPLHKNRERERGYNQSRLLAEELTARCGVLTAPGLLVRTRATAAQATLRPELRAANVSGAFATSLAEAVRGKNILLIDDVATTGSTLRACTEVLRRSGCAHVSALVGALS